MQLPPKCQHPRVRAFCHLAVLVLLVLASTSAGHAQYLLETGSPTFTTANPVELGFINVANGNLHLEAPVASAPQRGSVPFSARLVYDSRVWKTVYNGGSYTWQPTNVPNSQGWLEIFDHGR